jgi:hypothetical protein
LLNQKKEKEVLKEKKTNLISHQFAELSSRPFLSLLLNFLLMTSY